MPSAKGYVLNVVRMDRDRLRFDFTHAGRRVRGVVTVEALAAFIQGDVDPDSNLPRGSKPITLAEFADTTYEPFSARPRLKNPRSLSAEIDLIRALKDTAGQSLLHQLRPPDMEQLRNGWISKSVAANTIRRRLHCLLRLMDYAVATGAVAKNPLPPVRGLPVVTRADIWLNLEEVDRLVGACDETIRGLVEYLVLSGARISEALDFRAGDLRNGKLYVPTEKRRQPSRDVMREVDVGSLGPRFARLISALRPSSSGFYFHGPRTRGRSISYSHFQRLFSQARTAARLPHIRPHDLRGTFAMHRAMVVKNFRQLQVEMGHGSARSIESYLARAQRFEARESIFFQPLVAAVTPELDREQAAPVLMH